MPEVYEVANIEEAVELAHKLKDEGRYNWFRGQTQDWEPMSSLVRVFASKDSERELKFYRRVEMFSNWLNGIPELRYLREPEHVHDFFAIMQHYGIPTHYIDFTTDPGVAGFFAADTKTPPTEGKSCIYCLDTADLMDVWSVMKTLDERRGASIELVEIDVRNLWRLQAQRGIFLYANYNWQIDYPMDRILFPYSDYPSYPTRGQIYPEDKSPLEQLLDQYFFLETATFFNEEMEKMIAGLRAKGRNASYSEWEMLPGGLYAEAFSEPSLMTPLASWNPEALKAWETAPTEDYHQAVGPTLTLKIRPGADAEAIRKSVSFGVKQILRSNPAIRSKTVNWSFSELPESLSQKLNERLRPVWNGMRRLPYEDAEIADALAAVAALSVLGVGEAFSTDAELSLFAQCFGESIHVGFANRDRSGSQGVASRASLHKALRTDIAELLTPEFKERADDIYKLFGIIYNPSLMFEFDEFKSLFAREVIPAQAVRQRQLILFNPAHLITFGLP